jgi:hypothetical protein
MNLDTYGIAVRALLGAGENIAQRTPPALEIFQERDLSRRCSAKLASSPDSDSCCCYPRHGSRKRARSESYTPDPEFLPEKRAKRPTEVPTADDRQYWGYICTEPLVLPSYVTVRQMVAGSRRAAANVVYVMASRMNLEVCTPSFAMLVLDRFLSRTQRWFGGEEVLMVAMICLNMVGKIVDVDRGYCGSRLVAAMIRSAVVPELRCAKLVDFCRRAAMIERSILETLGSRVLLCPSALQYIAEATEWHLCNVLIWLRCAFIVDVFTFDSACTAFTQNEIARAVADIVEGRRPAGAACHDAIQRALLIYDRSSEETMLQDPYFGARVRHRRNPLSRLKISGVPTTNNK